MRFLLIIIAILGYLFTLVYIESALVKTNIRKGELKEQIQELKNRKANLQAELNNVSNIARIETEAKKRGFIFPGKDDVLGVIK